MCSMRPARNIHLEAYADASASGGKCTVGGFVQHPHLGQLWFSEGFTATDFHGLDIPVQHDMSKDIASYEALAQGGADPCGVCAPAMQQVVYLAKVSFRQHGRRSVVERSILHSATLGHVY